MRRFRDRAHAGRLLAERLLGGLALVLAISIFLLRRSAPGTAEPVT
jgi:hypothetical protein